MALVFVITTFSVKLLFCDFLFFFFSEIEQPLLYD